MIHAIALLAALGCPVPQPIGPHPLLVEELRLLREVEDAARECGAGNDWYCDVLGRRLRKVDQWRLDVLREATK